MKKLPKPVVALGAAAICSLFSFVLLVVLLKTLDVRAVGPLDSYVGLASLNASVFAALGVNENFELFTALLGGVALLTAGGGVAAYVVYLAVKKTKIRQIPPLFWATCVTLGLLMAAYLLFEVVVINYRPVLEDGALAASFPSSHTLLAVAVFGMVIPYGLAIPNAPLKWSVVVVSAVLAVLSVAGRLLAGVHWVTDIAGGVLLGLFFAFAFGAVFSCMVEQKPQA